MYQPIGKGINVPLPLPLTIEEVELSREGFNAVREDFHCLQSDVTINLAKSLTLALQKCGIRAARQDPHHNSTVAIFGENGDINYIHVSENLKGDIAFIRQPQKSNSPQKTHPNINENFGDD